MKKIFFLFCFFIFSGFLYAQSDKYFVKYFGTDTTGDDPYAIFQLPDQGYIFISNKYNFYDSYSCGILNRHNKYGDLIWEKEYCSDSGRVVFIDFKIVNNSYFMTGAFQDSKSGIYYTWLQKTDTSGNLLWSKILGDSTLNGNSFCIEPAYDGSFMLAGALTGSDTLGYLDALVLKVDSSGNLLEKKTYGQFGNNESLNWIEQTPDSGFVLVGSWGFIIDTSNMWIMKTDINGNKIWDRKYSFDIRTSGASIKTTFNNGLVVTGVAGPNFGEKNGYIARFDSLENLKWLYRLYSDDFIHQNSYLYHTAQLINGSFVAMGDMDIRHDIDMDVDIVLVKVSADGQEIWRRYYSNMLGEHDFGYNFSLTNDGGFIICARTEITPDSGNNIVFSDAMIIKTNCAGFTGPPKAVFEKSINYNHVQFQNHSDSAVTFKWLFGDGDSSIYDYDRSWIQVFSYPPDTFTHVYNDSGTYILKLIAYACDESDTLTDTLHVSLPVGIDKSMIHSPANVPFSIFTVPSGEQVILSTLNGGDFNNAEIRVHDITGRLVRNYTLSGNSGTYFLSTEGIKQGVYIFGLYRNGEFTGARKGAVW